MLGSIRERAKDNKVIYLFLDNAGYHSNRQNPYKEINIVKEAYEELNIVPVFNVKYQFAFNPVERYWAHIKHHFRRILLSKMLQCPNNKETPMKDALAETFKGADVSELVPKIIRMA